MEITEFGKNKIDFIGPYREPSQSNKSSAAAAVMQRGSRQDINYHTPHKKNLISFPAFRLPV